MEFAVIRHVSFLLGRALPASVGARLARECRSACLRAICLLALSSTAVLAQNIQLSAEQQRMLNQLPPAQQQLARDALKNQDSQTQTVLQPVRETVTPSPEISPAIGAAPKGVEPSADETTPALQPFGYDIFEPHEASFDPPMTGPVPPDYVLGTGDTVRVQLFGNVNGIYEFDVTRDGILNLPEIGPVTVTGLPFSEFRADINRRVEEMLIGTQVSVTMGQLRTIRIFVLGEANRPGSYVVSSLATISSALYRSGGISRIGTLRDIQLKRSGKIVSRLDLYDILLSGDTSGDARVQPGDVIFIPPVGTQVGVGGAVMRPATYETRGESSISDVIQIAGGLRPDAYPANARIERIDAGKERVIVSIDADSQAAENTNVRRGDVLIIPAVLPEFEYTVTLRGHVHRPGPYQWRDGMRLTDLLGSRLELKPGADSDYVMLRREDPENREVYVQSTNLNTALGDVIFIPPVGTQVGVGGAVMRPATYETRGESSISDVIQIAGGLRPDAYPANARIERIDAGKERVIVSIDADSQAAENTNVRRGDVLIIPAA